MRKIYLLFTIVFVAASLLNAQAPYRGEQEANTTTAANQKYPDVAVDTDGNFVMVWESFNQPNDEDGFAIVAQRFDSNGDPIAGERRVNQILVDDQIRPAIARDGLGNYYVVWQSMSQNDDFSWDIKMRKYDSDFSTLTGETSVNFLDSLEQREADVAANASGQYVVVWQSMESDSTYNIYARLYDTDDSTIDTTILVNSYLSNNQLYPSVAMDDDGNFFVVWQSYLQDGSAYGIYGQRFDITGAKLDSPSDFRINDENVGDQIRAKIATNANGRYIVTWASGEQDGSHLGIYGKVFNADGSERFSETLINQVTLDSQVDPDVDVDNSNNFVVTWATYVNDTTGTKDIAARRFDEDGSPLTDEFVVNSFTNNDQGFPTVGLRDAGEFVVGWASHIDDSSQRDDIRFQMYRMGPYFSKPTTISFDEDNSHEYNKSFYDPFITDDNHTDAELTLEFLSSTNLTVALNNDLITITPATDFSGTDSFRVVATDPTSLTDTTYQVVAVNPVDDVPTVANPIDDVEVDENAANTDIDLSDVFTDIDNDDLAITKEVFDNTNASMVTTSLSGNTLTLDFQENQSGTATITIRGTSGGVTVDDEFDVLVNAVDDAPTVANPIGDVTANEDAADTVIVLTDVFTDIDNDDAAITKAILTNTNSSLVNASIVGNNLTLDYQADSSGTATITVQATSNGKTVNDAFDVTVNPVDDDPVVANAIDDVEVDEDAANSDIDLAAVFSDIDNDDNAITKTVQNNTNESLVTASITNGVLTLDYLDEQSGTADITIRGTSNGKTVDDVFSVLVNVVDDAPVVVGPLDDVVAIEDGPTVDIDLSAIFSDVDNDNSAITKSVQNNTNETLVAASITDNTLTLDYLPNQSGEATITIRGTSNGLTVDDEILVTVGGINDPPTVANAIDDVEVDEDAVNTVIDLSAVFDDVDNDNNLIVKTLQGNSNATLVLATVTSNTLTLDYQPNQSGTATIAIRGSSGGQFIDDTFLVTVNPVDDAPTVANAMSDVIALEDADNTSIDLTNVFDDLDNDNTLITKAIQANDNTALVVASISGNVLTLDYQANQTGVANIVVRATSNGVTVDDSIVVTVDAADDPPFVANAMADVTVDEDAANTRIALAAVFSDIDNDDGAITKVVQTNTNESLVTATITNDTLVLDYLENQNGEATITIRGTSNGQSIDDVFEVTVNAINDIPVITGQIAVITAEETDIEIMLSQLEVEDVDNSYPTGFSLAVMDGDNYTRESNTITPVSNFFGDLTVPVQVNDGVDNSLVYNLTVTVDAVNDAPVITIQSVLTFNEDDSLMYNVSDFFSWVEDAETPDSLLMYSIGHGNTIWAVVDSPNVVIKAPNNWYGVDSITIIVSDGLLADTADVEVVVTSVNDAPVIVSVPDTVEFRNVVGYVINMLDWIDDADLPNDLLEWEFSVSNEAVSYNFDDETYELTLSAEADFWGDVELHFMVTDSSEASVHDSLIVVVTADPTSIEYLDSQIPISYELNQNYPNPFNPVTNIKFGLPKAGRVTIYIFNILGQKVETLLDEIRPAGYHTLSFDGRNLSSGVYFYSIQTQDFAQVKKMVLVK